MSSLNNPEKYEKILLEIGKKIKSNIPYGKTFIFVLLEQKKIILTEKELSILFEMESVLYKNIKNTEKDFRAIIKEILYPITVSEEKEEQEVEIELELLPTTPNKVELALEDFSRRGATTTNEHLIFRDVANQFNLTPEEEKTLKEEIITRKKTQIKEDIDKKQQGDINAAFAEVKAICIQNPYSVNTDLIKKIAKNHNVFPLSLKELFQQKREEIMEERRKIEII